MEKNKVHAHPTTIHKQAKLLELRNELKEKIRHLKFNSLYPKIKKKYEAKPLLKDNQIKYIQRSGYFYMNLNEVLNEDV